jgi:putative nucleotidyltransferase with HDIG domain
MNRKTVQFVNAVAFAALLLTLFVWRTTSAPSDGELWAALLLAGLAVVAEGFVFLLPNSASGSVAFIAYLSAVILCPNYAAVLAVVGARLLTELPTRREPIKRLFNVAQHAIIAAVAVVVLRALGGVSLLSLADASLLGATVAVGLPAVAAFAASLVANNLLLTFVLSLSQGKPPFRVFYETKMATIGVDLLAAPIVFIFAWLYAGFGPIAAVALWVPILGFRQLNRTNLELEQMNRELLQLMVKSIEARDPYTSGHSRRVQEYAVTIARGARLSERDVERISQAALLHDVGKINDKYHPILTKPDRLTPDEWAIMKEHPIDGANLVSTMTRLRHLLPAIRHHHENWDGTGYPDQIAGELIPIDARVIALADTIDAMSSARPYRPGLTPEQVRAEIVRCRGKQFDPDLADRVLSSAVWSSLFPEAATFDAKGAANLKILRPEKVAV